MKKVLFVYVENACRSLTDLRCVAVMLLNATSFNYRMPSLIATSTAL